MLCKTNLLKTNFPGSISLRTQNLKSKFWDRFEVDTRNKNMILVEFGHHIFSSFLETKEVITVSDFSKHFSENNTTFRKYLEFPC